MFSKPFSAIRIFSAAIAALAMVSVGEAKTLNVFLVGGQSNAAGMALAEEIPGGPVDLKAQQDEVLYFTNDKKGRELTTLRPTYTETYDAAQNPPGRLMIGPEIAFGRSMADYFATSGQSVAILKFAVNSTSLAEHWKVGSGPLHGAFKAAIADGLAALAKARPNDKIVIRGMIWMQGENDAADIAFSRAYQENLEAFISDLRATYGKNLPFVLGRLSVNQFVEPGGFGITNKEGFENVRAAQKAVGEADAFTAWVDTDTITTWFHPADKFHFDSKGQIALGAAFAASMQKLVVP